MISAIVYLHATQAPSHLFSVLMCILGVTLIICMLYVYDNGSVDAELREVGDGSGIPPLSNRLSMNNNSILEYNIA